MQSKVITQLRRRQKELFRNVNVDVFFIPNFSNDISFCYFTDLPLGMFTYNSLIMESNGKRTLLSNALQDTLLKKLAKKCDFKVVNTRKVGYWKTVKRYLNKKRVGVNYAEISLALFNNIKKETKANLVDIGKDVSKLREKKDKEEQRRLKIAARKISSIIENVPNLVKRNISERELSNKIDLEIRNIGLEPAFQTIVASANNAATPHHIPGNMKLKKGFLIVDAGVRYKNYCSDISRTFYLGKAKENHKKLYETVLSAKSLAEDTISSGDDAASTFKVVENFLNKRGFKLLHALGHGLGLEIHDVPGRISRDSKFKFVDGLCFTLEPAIYGSFGGIRIENDYLIKDGKPKKISNATETLQQISLN
ncbi:MAG: Xaa-Pro peptidase family protein [Candidatus Diapherotrites archaeon]